VRAKPKKYILKKKKKQRKRVRHAKEKAASSEMQQPLRGLLEQEMQKNFCLILLPVPAADSGKKSDKGNKCLILREEILTSFQAGRCD
jgi:hypothetical protein